MALTQTALEFANDVRYCGPLPGATHRGISGAQGEGPFMLIELHLEGSRIVDARYQTYGCPTARACGSLVCRLLAGRTTEQGLLIAAGDIVVILGGVPEGKEHCPRMTQEAVQRAIGSPIEEKTQP